VPCAILDPKLVGDFALPLDEVAKAPGCRQPKDPDVAEAKRLVEKHYPGGLDVEVAVRQVGNYVDRGQLVIAQLRKIGIRGTMKTHESAAGYAAFGKGDFTIIATQDRAMDVNEPSGVFHISYTSQSGSNYGQYADSKVDELTDRALKETNHDKRKQAYWELQRYLLSKGDHASIAVGWVEGWFFKDKKLRNYKPGLTTYDNNTFMKVWIAQ
jgi:ABC-type transport system substrate-binding protein